MPELTGKLDTPVNGPEGLLPFDGDAWGHVDWRHHEEQVRRLRGRIFKAVQEGDWPLARNHSPEGRCQGLIRVITRHFPLCSLP
jgi:hypothetical protein